jgi:large subunit ribosomal protein L23
MQDVYHTIQNILLTEKATQLGETNNDFVFKVHPKANKFEIAKAIETIFGKTVINVRTMNCDGKLRRKRTKDEGTTPSWKKAIVRLKEGDRIDLL